ncbi:MAG TPA: tetratricopeptide repeat protein [Bryobacteraceae bacterium]|nr:tetratricopeptide repeat protein [Bryobacteraceae bacterium]
MLLLWGAACAQEAADGLLPPPGQDRSPRVAGIRQALLLGDLVRARTQAASLEAEEPRNCEGPFWQGYLALRSGEFYDAIRALRRAEALTPTPAVRKVLAVAYYGAHQQRLFARVMRQVLAERPQDFAPYYYLGRYYESDLTDFAQAAALFRQAIERNPTHWRSHYYLGHCLEVQQKWAEAEAEYQQARSLGDGLAEQGLARLRLAADRPAEALPLARKAADLAPRDAATHKLLARVYSEIGREKEAAAEWKLATTLDPADVSSLYRLYRAYQSAGDVAQAQAALKQYQKIVARYGTN